MDAHLMPAITSVAALKRALPKGAVVHVENLVHPPLSGERIVLKAQTQRLCLSFPEGHPKHGDPGGSWLDFPKSSEVRFEDGKVVILRGEGWPRAGEPWCVLTVKSQVES